MPNPLAISWRAFLPRAKAPQALPDVRHAKSLRGKRVLVRASVNVPVRDSKVVNDYRLRVLLPTIHFLQKEGARTILIGHLGRDPELSLRPVAEELSTYTPVRFVQDVVGKDARRAVEELGDGDVLMLENLRSHPGERENSKQFAEELAALGDIYVNDAFSVSHRVHASVVTLPKLLPHFAGFQMIREVEELTKALTPQEPSLCILGGVKFETKRPLIEKFSSAYSTLFVGGAIANDFFCAKGYSVGVSALSKDAQCSPELLKTPNVVLPSDAVVSKEGVSRVTSVDSIAADEYISDIGPKSLNHLKEHITKARYILWNGPLGDTDIGFAKGTEEVARAIGDTHAETIVGGGDTVAAIARLHLEDKLTFISTGGGSMLQFLADETLPGIEALK